RPNADATSHLRFEVTRARHLDAGPEDGRLLVVLSADGHPEPRLAAGSTGLDAPPILARDVVGFRPGATAVLDERAAAFPIADLSLLPAGAYFVQAVFDTNRDLKG